jgi:hypothetical protein
MDTFNDERETQHHEKKTDPVGFTLSTIVAVGCGIPLVLGMLAVLWAILRARGFVG